MQDHSGVGYENQAYDDEEEQVKDVVINIQPDLCSGDRAVLPVPTINWISNTRGQYMTKKGLDFLIDVTTLLIQQTAELNDITSKIESENRFTVKIPNGESLFIASEVSSSLQRCICGSSRKFLMHIHDNTRQEAIQLSRRLAVSSFWFPWRLQEMTVVTPPGDYIGRIKQEWTWFVPYFLVLDSNDTVVYAIQGPKSKWKKTYLDTEFHILSNDAYRVVGSIMHSWNSDLVNYTTVLNLPDTASTTKEKALLLAATFLMEYTYFEWAKSRFCGCLLF